MNNIVYYSAEKPEYKKVYSINSEICLKETYIKHVWFKKKKTVIYNSIPAAFPQRVMMKTNSLTF